MITLNLTCLYFDAIKTHLNSSDWLLRKYLFVADDRMSITIPTVCYIQDNTNVKAILDIIQIRKWLPASVL